MRIHGFLRLAALCSLGAVAAPIAAQSGPAARNLVLPYLGSAPETGVQYGVAAFHITQPRDTATRPSTTQLFASYTAKRQARAFAELDRWTTGSDWRVVAHVEWKRFPLPFYGFGDQAPEVAEEFYTPIGVLASALVQRRVRGPLFVAGGYAWQDLRISASSPNGALGTSAVRGSRGGRIGQLTGGVLWDTRDDIFAASRGKYLEAKTAVAARGFGSDFAFTRHTIDVRYFLPVGSERVIAFEDALEVTRGAPPFDALSLVGSGSYLRGYTRGRFRDRDLVATQVEYRAPLRRKYRWVAFGGLGRIAPNLSQLFDAGPTTLPSYGLGLRRTLFSNSRSAIRVDYARGSTGQSGLYVNINEAF